MKHTTLSYDKVKESIPSDAVTMPMENWDNKGKIEWRWRFLVFPHKRSVEISKLCPESCKREYINQEGKFIRRIVDPIFDKYVTETYYYYADI